MKPSICIEMLFPDQPFEERVRRIASYGFGAVEFWSWRDKDLPRLKSVADGCGVEIANFSGQRVGDLLDPGQHEVVLRDFESALSSAATLGCRNLMVLAQELGEGGRVVRQQPHEAAPEQIAAIAAGVRRLLERIPGNESIQISLEPLNTRLDHAGYALSSVRSAAKVVEAVADPRFGLLVDFYHQGVMGDDLVGIVRTYARMMKHVHIADVPGRHEPGTGSVDWASIIGELGAQGYEGYVGFEFSPVETSEAALASLREFWERVPSGT